MREHRDTEPRETPAGLTAPPPRCGAQIANYESGRKKGLDITELLVLAAALNISPVCLIYPGPYEQTIDVLPGRAADAKPPIRMSQFDAVQWFSGNDYFVLARDDYGSEAEYAAALEVFSDTSAWERTPARSTS